MSNAVFQLGEDGLRPGFTGKAAGQSKQPQANTHLPRDISCTCCPCCRPLCERRTKPLAGAWGIQQFGQLLSTKPKLLGAGRVLVGYKRSRADVWNSNIMTTIRSEGFSTPVLLATCTLHTVCPALMFQFDLPRNSRCLLTQKVNDAAPQLSCSITSQDDILHIRHRASHASSTAEYSPVRARWN